MRDPDHLFICDDSQDPEVKSEIDAFAAEHTSRCTVLRRNSLDGFKAGNLNHALAVIGDRFPYFCVVDHDNLIHPLARDVALSEFTHHPQLAFLQFAHIEEIQPAAAFADDLRLSVRIAWWAHSLRTKYGLPISIGHGVFFRTSTVRSVGGFPCLLTEDLAVTITLLGAGLIGRYDLRSPCVESVPATYARYRARYVRWCLGSLQTMLGPLISLPRSAFLAHHVWDGFLQMLHLLYPFPILLFGLAWALLATDTASAMYWYTSGIGGTIILAMIAPSIPVLLVADSCREGLRSLAAHAAVHLSIIVPTIICAAVLFCGGRGEFINTGNKYLPERRGRAGSHARFGANGSGTVAAEAVAGILLVLTIDRFGIIGLPVFAGIVAGLTFQYADWVSVPAKLARHLTLVSILVSGVVWTATRMGY